MKVERQIQFWLVAALVFAVLLWLLSGVLLPFAAGLTLAYLLDPIATRLQRIGMSRLVASLLIVGISGLLIFSAVVALLPILLKQAAQFIERLPAYAAQLTELLGRYGDQISGRIQPALEFFGLQPLGGEGEVALPKPGELVGQGARWIGTLLASIWQGGQALVGVVVAARDHAGRHVLPAAGLAAPAGDASTISCPCSTARSCAVWRARSTRAMAGFIRGQSFVCLFLGLWYGLGFTMVGLNFGMLIGITAGAAELHSLCGLARRAGLFGGRRARAGAGHGACSAMVLAVQFTGQFIEGNILTPRFVGGAVGLHPVWMMFALLAFGSLFGFTGLILAVPIAAVIGVLTRFGVRQYMASPLYTGEQRLAAKDPDTFP